jgi:hypothetical protein
MSGFEIAGILLGAFPLIISGLEHWRDVAKVSGFYWRVREEYTRCRSDMKFHEILYKRNLQEILLPIVNDTDEVDRLISEPTAQDWSSKALQERLVDRLQESYGLYMDIICQMNETAKELGKELSLDNNAVQSRLAPSKPLSRTPKPSSAKSKWDYETFRLKFSFNEPVRKALLNQLKDSNERLEKLLRTSDRMSALQDAVPASMKQTHTLEKVFKKAWRRSDLLFRALRKAWQCTCQQYHFANLRLEHRTVTDVCFEVILMFVPPSPHVNIPWSWRELQCGQMIGCSAQKLVNRSKASQPSLYPPGCTPAPASLPILAKRRKVAFTTPPDILVEPNVKLCQLLGEQGMGDCMGIIGHDDETYHLHPFTERNRPEQSDSVTLDHILSSDFEGRLSRRQRYFIALLLASSVAQLQFSPWLKTGLTKEDVVFYPSHDDVHSIPYREPFILQGFPLDDPVRPDIGAGECNFYSLGILLLELCFGQRLEDHPLRKKHPTGVGEVKQAFDLMASLQWSRSVFDDAGHDYEAAVKWCFTGANSANQPWRNEIIKNVIRPLEKCQDCFKEGSLA